MNVRALIGGLFALLILSCHRSPSEVRIVLNHPVLDLQPVPAEHETSVVLKNIYESLVEYDAELNIIPCLSVSWVTPDTRTWIFRLRDGVRFHNGRPLTAVDVMDSFRSIQKTQTAMVLPHLDLIFDISAPDPRTVKITTKAPVSGFLHLLTGLGVCPAGAFAKGIGTGPYALKTNTKEEVLLERFNRYWASSGAVVDRLRFRIIPTETSLKEITARGGDFIIRDAQRFNEPMPRGCDFRKKLGLSVSYLGFNVRTPPFDNPHLRRAIGLAVDREAIVRERLGGNAYPTCQCVPFHAFGYDPKLPCAQDLEGARRELQAGGIRTPLDLKVHITARGEKTIEFVRRDLRKIGITLTPVVLSWPELYDRMVKRTVDCYFTGYVSGFGNAEFTLETLCSSRGSFNSFDYQNEEVNRLLDEAQSTLKDADRLPLLHKAIEAVGRDAPMAALYNLYETYAVSSTLAWTPRADGMILGKEIGFR